IPCGHMRSPGDPQGFFANESQMDLIAKKLGMDPIKLRQKNFMHDGDIDPTGEEYSYIRTDETLKKALSQIKTRQLDTQNGIKDTGVGGSRATRVYGTAGYQAALKAVVAIKQAAASQMGVAADQITLVKGAALHPRMERRLTYGEIVKGNGAPITVDATFND